MGDGTCFRPTIGDRLRFGPALGNGLGSGRRWGMALVRTGDREWPWFGPILAEGERLTVIYITVDCDTYHQERSHVDSYCCPVSTLAALPVAKCLAVDPHRSE